MASHQPKVANLDPWISSLAGLTASLASCIFHPLDNVKFRFQASNLARNNPIPAYKGIYDALGKMYAEGGAAMLYRGVVINIIAGSASHGLFFFIYADGKNRYNYDKNHPYSLKAMAISLRAGLISMALTAPLWVVKTRLILYREQLGIKSQMILREVVRDMYRNEGISSFYKGFVPSIFLSLYGVIQMFCYENVNYLIGNVNRQDNKGSNFLIPFVTGGISKSCASAALMPLNVVRMRLQMKNYTEEEIKKLGLQMPENHKQEVKYKGLWDCATKIYKNEGITAFYKGLTPSILKIFPASGLFFVTYEGTLKLFGSKTKGLMQE